MTPRSCGRLGDETGRLSLDHPPRVYRTVEWGGSVPGVDVNPVEYVVIEFPGNRFTGDIAPAIADLVDRGLVRILDLIFVKKDASGAVSTFEYDELEETAVFGTIDGDADGLLSDEDVVTLASDLAPESAALFILFEDLWAGPLGRAVWDAGGELVAGGRIPHALVQAAMDEIEHAGTEGAPS